MPADNTNFFDRYAKVRRNKLDDPLVGRALRGFGLYRHLKAIVGQCFYSLLLRSGRYPDSNLHSTS